MRSSCEVSLWKISLAIFVLLFPLMLFAGAPTPTTGSHSLVISQFYWGNGSTTNAPWGSSYVEIFNAGSQAVDLQNWTLVYSPTTDTASTFVEPTPGVAGNAGRQWIGSIDPYNGYCASGCQITYSLAFQASNCNAAPLAGQYTKHCWLNPGQYMLIKVKSASSTGSIYKTVSPFPLQADLDISISSAPPAGQPDPITLATLAPNGSAGKIALVNSRDAAPSCNYVGTAPLQYGNVLSRTAFAPAVIDFVGYSATTSTSATCWEGTSATAPSWSVTATDYTNGYVDIMNAGMKNKAAFMRTSGFAGPHNGSLQTAYGNFTVTSNPCADSDNNAADFGPVNIGLGPNGSAAGTGMTNWFAHNSYQYYDVSQSAAGQEPTSLATYTPQPCTGRSSAPPTVTVTADKTEFGQAAGQVANVNLTIAVKPSTQPVAIFFQMSGSASGITGATLPAPSAWADGGWDDNGNHIYTTTATVPTDNAGTATITVNALDDAYRTGTGEVTIKVGTGSSNNPPVAVDSSVTVYYNTPTEITLGASDQDGDPLTYTVTSGPSHGSLSATSGSSLTLTYTPSTGYTGTDSFTFKVNDGKVDSNVATVTINIPTPSNPAVVLSASQTACALNGVCNVTLTATVTPGASPASTGIAVSGNLSACTGGSPNQIFTDSGDHLTFTASCSIPTTTECTLTLGPAIASDAQFRTSAASNTVSITVTTPVASTLTAPTVGTVLSGNSATFTWTAGTLVDHYMLMVGTSQGSTDVYYSGNVTSTTATVTGLRSTDGKVYVRLYSWIPSLNGWQYNDYGFDYNAPQKATLTSPVGSINGASATFTWTPGNMVTKYMLFVGTAQATGDVFYSGETTSTTLDVSGLRSTNGNIYVRLYSWYENGWHFNDYTFAYATPAAAQLTSPLGSINGTSATFTWTTGNQVTKYMLYVGTAPGTPDDFYSGEVTTTSLNVNGLRSTDGHIYVRLYSWFENGWHYNDYTLTHIPPVQPVAADLTAPVAISGTTAEFTWTAGTAIGHYMLCVGTQAGGTDNYYSGPTTSRDIVVDGLRTTDGNIYVRLYSWATDHWLWHDYVFPVQ